jgi:iron complex transport system substrate-binding protein
MKKYALLFSLLLVSQLGAREITDMAGRKVVLPEKVERSFASAPPMGLLSYIVAPETMTAMNVGLNSQFYASNTKYLDKSLEKLPVVGGWHGGTKGANMETLLALKPQIVLAWKSDFVMKEVEKQFAKFGVPVVFIQEDLVEDEPNAIRFVGHALGREERAEALAKDAENRLAYIAKMRDAIVPSNRPVVYYAEGADGLATECAESFHFSPLKFVGVRPAFACVQKTMIGMEKVSMEQIISVNPDVIIAADEKFFKSVYADARWAGIKAVKNKRVYLTPKDPVNFLDRPPSFMRILGVEWLASVIYPKAYKKDISKETESFYHLYLRRDITTSEAAKILGR